MRCSSCPVDPTTPCAALAKPRYCLHAEAELTEPDPRQWFWRDRVRQLSAEGSSAPPPEPVAKPAAPLLFTFPAAAIDSPGAGLDPYRLWVAVETCPFGDGSCGCFGGPPRRCTDPDRPVDARSVWKADCQACQVAKLSAP